MSKIYITGHRNPDLDSLCSASAYARLKNLTDPENEYIAGYISRIAKEYHTRTDRQLYRFMRVTGSKDC